MIADDSVLAALVTASRKLILADRHYDHSRKPWIGDLVVETTHGWRGRPPDPDAIGWLVGNGRAPYNADDPTDGSVPMREVWDVLPLSGRTQHGWGYLRWENAEFKKVPTEIAKWIKRDDTAPTLDAILEARSEASYALNPNQGEPVDPTTAHLWLRTTFPSDHPNYLSRDQIQQWIRRTA